MSTKDNIPTDTEFLSRNDMILLVRAVLYEKHNDFFMRLFRNEDSKLVSKSVIQNLSIVKVDPDQLEECVICYAKFHMEEKVRQLPCIHSFLEQCIKKWFKITNTSPFCRFKIE